MSSDVIMVIVVAAALAFDFTNGFHDTANVVATSVSTRALSPRAAVTIAALLNFVGAFISLEVAATIASEIVDQSDLTGNKGTTVVALGSDAVLGDGLVGEVLVPALVAPTAAFLIAGAAILVIYRVAGRLRPGPVTRGFRFGQVVSGGLLALAHGTNDAQKTMGVITLALVANGTLSGDEFHVPDWVVISAATAIALGTYVGGWRIIKTMGSRIHKMDAAQGFSAQGAGAAVILASSHVGFPLSTTHTISGGVLGAGAAKRLSAVRWGVAGNIVAAWILTLPAAGAIGALAYGVTRIFGTGALGPIVVSVMVVGL